MTKENTEMNLKDSRPYNKYGYDLVEMSGLSRTTFFKYVKFLRQFTKQVPRNRPKNGKMLMSEL